MREWTDKTVMHSYPGMVALVTASWNGQQNIMAAGWHTYISFEPPIYGVAIAKERFSHHLIRNSGEFAINFVGKDYAHYNQTSGTITGKVHNKFESLNIQYEQGKTIQAPILKEAYIAYECKVMDKQTYGDHDWFVGEMTGFYKDEGLFRKDGLPDLDKLSIPLYMGRSQYFIANDKSKLINLYQDNS
ncbi:flavin reductase family protein [Sutcliffiella rhizosphaerae]|uniref:Flavoredoxin n=1 Tax=Sutcliffiella rhizosphaerae TaxID=2880967 RepID=A0ABN8A2Y1_9BACI|nr:flavin reductase family protein [Sutcliffiella rhizosphaerae]CAG9619364.1 Flavoredoxin [Sutcliffiella rhizosphaerae]